MRRDCFTGRNKKFVIFFIPCIHTFENGKDTFPKERKCWYKVDLVPSLVNLFDSFSVFLHFEKSCRCLLWLRAFEHDVSCFVSFVTGVLEICEKYQY